MGRTIIDGKPHYQVKWQGTEEMTWEPIENLEGVAWMVEELENAMNNNPEVGMPDASGGFEGCEQQMEDEYMQAEQNSIMHNQGLPISNTVQNEVRSRPLTGLDMIQNIRGRGNKRQGKDHKVKEPQSLPHDLTSESLIIKQSQKR